MHAVRNAEFYWNQLADLLDLLNSCFGIFIKKKKKVNRVKSIKKMTEKFSVY